MVALVPNQIRERILTLLRQGNFIAAKKIYDEYPTINLEPMCLIQPQQFHAQHHP